MTKSRTRQKTIAAIFLLLFSVETFLPSVAFAITSGPTTPEMTAFQPASIYFTSNRNELDQLANLYPELSLITTNLLRLYGTLFYHPTPVRLQAIARQTRLKQETIHQYLLQLDKMELIEYRPTKEGAQLYFHHLRADSRHLIIDVQRINVLKKKHEARIRTMTDFLLEQHTCRERYLLHFFGENAQEDCKH